MKTGKKLLFALLKGILNSKSCPWPFELHLPPFKTVLSGLQGTSSLVYLDDIIVMGKTFAEHLNDLDLVFSRIRDAGFKITRKVLEKSAT